MKKLLLAALAAILALTGIALAETGFSTDGISLTLTDNWADVTASMPNHSAAFLREDGALLTIQTEDLLSGLDESDGRQGMDQLFRSLSAEAMRPMILACFEGLYNDDGTTPAVVDADLGDGLAVGYCLRTVQNEDDILAVAMLGREKWTMSLSNDTHTDHALLGGAQLETYMLEVLSGMRSQSAEAASDEAAPEAPAPEEASPEEDAAPVSQLDDDTDAILTALGDEVYRTTYQALLEGDPVGKGSRGDVAKGVQQTLVAFGQKIAVDGSVGGKTIAALNAVQSAFGLEQTDSLDAEGYAALMPRLLFVTQPEKAETMLKDTMSADEYRYLQACAYLAQGQYYRAKLAFGETSYGDASQRAAECAQKWPSNGVLYKNPDVRGGAAELRVKANQDASRAILIKIYTMDGVLARAMFIGGSKQATTSLPAGDYIVKSGSGSDWYGLEDAFGNEGSYTVMTFNGGEKKLTLKRNYITTITLNTSRRNKGDSVVGSSAELWGDF